MCGSLILFKHPRPSHYSLSMLHLYTHYSSLTVYNIFLLSFLYFTLWFFIVIKESLSNLFCLASSEIFLKCNFCVYF